MLVMAGVARVLAGWAVAGMVAGCASGPGPMVSAPTTPDGNAGPPRGRTAKESVPSLVAFPPPEQGLDVCVVTPDSCACPANPPCPTKASCSGKSSCSGAGKATCAGKRACKTSP
jgi:hypothetical protein